MHRKMFRSSVMVLLLEAIFVNIQCVYGELSLSARNLTECNNYNHSTSEPGVPMFVKDDNVVPTNERVITVSSQSARGCVVNASVIQDALRNDRQLPDIRTERISLFCEDGIRIHVHPVMGYWTSTSVIGYLFIINCAMTYEDLENLFPIFNVLVLKLDGVNLTHNEKRKSCIDFANITSVLISRNKSDLLDLFHCNKPYAKIAELVLEDTKLSAIPASFKETFPNLQLLAVTNNSMGLPSQDFPWMNQIQSLPLNLTRTSYYNSILSASHRELREKLFKREYILDSNNIRNITEFVFHGSLEAINLKDNGIQEIGDIAFSRVTGLLMLILSYNEISSISCTVFNHLVNLTSLELSRNKLQNISNCAFESLVNLQYIDLSYNTISELGQYVFAKMKSLRNIDLGHNSLKELHSTMFPTGSINLKELNFRHNSLKMVPHFVFLVRSLGYVDLKHNMIKMELFNETIHNMSLYQLKGSVANFNFDDKEINLKHNRIKHPFFLPHINDEKEKLRVLLNSFTFYLSLNNLVCDCRIGDILDLKRRDSFYDDWKCSSPPQLKGQLLMDVKKADLYCPPAVIQQPEVESCPVPCECLVALLKPTNIIIECRGKNLTGFNHASLPNNTKQLWLSENYIVDFQIPDSSLGEIEVLDLSKNKLVSIHRSMLERMTKLRILNMHSNFITELPEIIVQSTATTISVTRNNFRCDCKSLWMKDWLIKDKHKITDWELVTCTYKKAAEYIVRVPDEDFVCQFSFETMNIILVSTFVGMFVLVIIVYINRARCKISLYIYFGLHPFDNYDEINRQNLDKDCVVLHSERYKQWVTEHIVQALENASFQVVDTSRDFVIGMTFLENLTSAVNRSKRMVLVFADEVDVRNAKLKLGWALALEKIKNDQSNFGIIVTRGVHIDSKVDSNLNRYMKAGCFVDFSKDMCIDKLKYYLPVQRIKQRGIPNSDNEKEWLLHKSLGVDFFPSYMTNQKSVYIDKKTPSGNKLFDAFVFYGEDDYDYVMSNLRLIIEDNGFSLCIPDRDIRPGRRLTNDTNIAIQNSLRTIIVLSVSSILDDFTTITFIEAHRKSLRDKTNHLLVIIREDIPSQEMSVEIRTYLKSYVSLHADDPWFKSRLLNSLPTLHKTSVVRQDLQEAFLVDTPC